MENLRDYRKRISTIFIAWELLVFVLAGASAYALHFFMEPALIITIAALICVFGTVLIGIMAAKPLSAPTEYLARAILHVSSESSGTPAPDPTTLKTSRPFLEQLASYVYDMASKSVAASYPAKKIDDPKEIKGNDAAGLLLRGSPLPIIVVNKNRQIIAASHSTFSYLGVDGSKVLDRPFFDVLKFSFSSDDTLDNWLKFAEDKSVTGIRIWDRVKLTMPNDTVRQLDIAVRYSRDEINGYEMIIMLFDHTEKYSQDDAGASFVSMAVHELRTPLTIMRGYIEVFEDELKEKLDQEQSEFLRNLSAQAQQLGAFVSNIQNLSRIESNSLELQLKQENWVSILEGVITDMEIRAKVRHKVIKTDFPDSLPLVAVDRVTIYEVLVNLIENAIKYTHSDEPITIHVTHKDSSWIETTVEDHGIGIPDSLIGHVFDKFYRSHRSSRAVGGTGLGLFIAKTIVNAHGGEIWVKSKEGQGTTFGFTVPTYESVATQVKSGDNDVIERRAHGWIKNHTLYRG